MPDFVRPSEMMTVEDVARKLGCIPSYIRHLCRRQMIGHYKIGKFLKFDQAQVDSFLAKHKIEEFIQPEKKAASALDLRMGKF